MIHDIMTNKGFKILWGGDYPFLAALAGHGGTSATQPCLFCMVTLTKKNLPTSERGILI